jgi:phage-related protein
MRFSTTIYASTLAALAVATPQITELAGDLAGAISSAGQDIQSAVSDATSVLNSIPTAIPTNLDIVSSLMTAIPSEITGFWADESRLSSLVSNTQAAQSFLSQFGPEYSSYIQGAGSIISALPSEFRGPASSAFVQATSFYGQVSAAANSASGNSASSNNGGAKPTGTSSSEAGAPTGRAVQAAGVLAAAGMAGVFLL